MEDNLLIGIDDYKILNEENPIGYTRDISTCIVCLIHRENDTVFIHIESDGNEIYLENFMEFIKPIKDNKIKNVDLFLGDYTSYGNLSIIKFILHRFDIKYNEYKVFKNNSNETSVGYNFNTKEYYMVRMNKGNPLLFKKKINM